MLFQFKWYPDRLEIYGMEKENNTTALHLERNQPDPTLLENEPLSAHARHFPLTGTASRGIKERAQL
jgi:hypothetical protein